MTTQKIWAASTAPPTDHPYASALWLMRRHQVLHSLSQRIPGVWTRDDDGLFVDLEVLAETINDFDELVARSDRPAEGTAEYAFACMSRTEQSRLRLLATFSTVRVGFKVGDLGGFDDAGRLLIVDWLAAVGAA